jgi:hypothetical protein
MSVPEGFDAKELVLSSLAFVFVLLIFGRIAWTALGLLLGF